MQNNGTHIQWRYSGEATWHDLVDLNSLRGPTGTAGAPGTVLAYARYTISGTSGGSLTLAADIASTDDSLIDQTGNGIRLATGHTYEISYNLAIRADAGFEAEVSVDYGPTILYNLYKGQLLDDGKYWLSVSNTTIAEGRSGTLTFDFTPNVAQTYTPTHSYVSITCIK